MIEDYLLNIYKPLFSLIPLPFCANFDGCVVLNCLLLVYFYQLGFIEPWFRILINLALIGLIFVSNYFVGIFVKQFWSLDINYKMKREFPLHCDICLCHFHITLVFMLTFSAHNGFLVNYCICGIVTTLGV